MKITQLYYTIARLSILILVLWVAFTSKDQLAILYPNLIALYIICVIAGLILPAMLPEIFDSHRATLNALIDLFLVSFAVIATGGLSSPLLILYLALMILYAVDVPSLCQAALLLMPILVSVGTHRATEAQPLRSISPELILIGLSILLALAIARRIQGERQRAKRINSSYETINILTKALMSSMKLDEVLKLILQHVIHELHFDRAFIFNLEAEKGERVLQYLTGVGVATDWLAKKVYYVDSRVDILGAQSDGIIPRTFARNRSYLVQDAPNDYNCDQELVEQLQLKSFLAVPLSMRDNSAGVLVVDRPFSGKPITENDRHSLRLFADYAAIAISHAQMYEAVERLSILDGMTGAFNHRYFRQSFGDYLHLAHRYNHPVSLVMIDVDNFKALNDRYGHQAGDAVLIELVEVMRSVLRVVDVLARYGGEEFVILLPEVNREGARKAAERLRKAVEKTAFEIPGDTLEVTISLGIATFRDDGTELETLIKVADSRLYEAKRSGKNQVCIEALPKPHKLSKTASG